MVTRQDHWLGAIRLQAPRLGWVCAGAGLLAITAIVSLLFGGHYTRHTQVDGTLVPSRGLLTVTPATPGVVTRVLVHENEPVSAGQPLLEISVEQDSAALGDTHAAIADQLQFKRERLLADLQEQQQLAQLQEQDLRERLVMLHGQIAQMDQQMVLQKQRADSASALYEQWSKLGDSGVVSRLQLLQQHDAALQNMVELKQINGQELQLRQQAAQLQGELDQLPATSAGKRNATERQLADTAQALSQNAAQRAVVLRAPADGNVANVLVHPGQAVTAQQSMLTVLPARSALLAELWLPTQAIGFVHPGAPVVIRYPAYPYQKFGQHLGRVCEVSRSAVSAAVLSQLLGQDIKEPRYRVQVTLDRQSVLAYGRAEPLKPGMLLDADVLLDRRRLLEWVIEPLSGAAHGQSVDVGLAEAR